MSLQFLTRSNRNWAVPPKIINILTAQSNNDTMEYELVFCIGGKIVMFSNYLGKN